MKIRHRKHKTQKRIRLEEDGTAVEYEVIVPVTPINYDALSPQGVHFDGSNYVVNIQQ